MTEPKYGLKPENAGEAEEQDDPPVPALPDGIEFTGWAPTWKPEVPRLAQYRQGLGVPFTVHARQQWGRSGKAAEYTHLLGKVSGSVRVERSSGWYGIDPDDRPGATPTATADLPYTVMLSATWKCGNSVNGAVLLDKAVEPLCPACHGLPTRHPRRLLPPLVRALPDHRPNHSAEQQITRCLASVLLPDLTRRCSRPATWEWASTPLCHTHLAAARTWWFTENAKDLY